MAARPERDDDVLDLALRAGDPPAALDCAERTLIARRRGPPEVVAAVRRALTDATGEDPADTPGARTALAIAEAVERHGAEFPPGGEPPYHDRRHQAEATIAMGWLAGAARRLGLLDREGAELAVAAMAAHDLLHDGRAHAERGFLERRSACAAARIAAHEGLEPPAIAAIGRIILATTWPWADSEAPDLSCRLAREADLFGSSLPTLGPRLSRLLAAELAATQQPSHGWVASHSARVALLRLLPPASAPARALGLDHAQAAQLDAYARAARYLRLDPATPDAGAAALDEMDATDGAALLAWSERPL